MSVYFRPLVQHGAARPASALPLAGQAGLWFTHAERLERGQAPDILPADAVPPAWQSRLTAPRAPVAGLEMAQPQVMGILNVTPDSFSDGGRHLAVADALTAGHAMQAAGAAILDVGGESTRPGADFVPEDEEMARTAPVIEALRAELPLPVSIDTRKLSVARAAVQAGAALVNDVSGFTFDAGLAPFCGKVGLPVCVMHAQGDPATMQDAPEYDDVLLDVYDHLEARIDALGEEGIPRGHILADPGIGFGKTQAHNLALLKGLSLFHGLGCALLLGVSRKRFVGTLGQAPEPTDRMPGSVAVGLAGLAQGVQILRVHDVAETVQAIRLWQAVR